MKQIQVNFEEKDIENMDLLVKNGMYPNLAELVRLAVRDLLIKHGRWPPKKNK